MSFELFPQENANVLASFGATQRRDPGVFDNFFPSAGNAIMRGFAETGRAVSMLGAVGPMLQDTGKYGQRGTEAVDKYFKRHDDIWNRAVEYWTPKRSEVGVAGEVVGQLLGTIPLLVASPAALVAKTQMSTGEDLVRKGVDADKAGAVGAVQAAGLGLGVWLPVLGKTLAQRVVIGGAGFNAVQGAATRGVSGAILEGTKAADEFKAFDPTAVTLDVLLGLAFGGIAHLSPAQRAQGEAAWSKIAEWTGTFKPSDIDALVTLKQAEHMNVESAPGRMATAEDIAKHHAVMKQAVDDVLNDRPVNVEQMPQPKVEADPERIAYAKQMADELQAQASEAGLKLDEMRAEESPQTEQSAADRSLASMLDDTPRPLLQDVEYRGALEVMAEETGLAERGGYMIRDPVTNQVSGRTEAVANAEWWLGRPGYLDAKGRVVGRLSEAKVKEAVRKALAGEHLGKLEQQTIDYMLHYADEVLIRPDKYTAALDEQTRADVANALLAEELDVTPRNIADADMVARAIEIDEARVESAAIRYDGDDAGFIEEIRAILRENQSNSQAVSSRPETGAATQGEAARPGQTGEVDADPIRAAADQFVAERPDLTLTIGADQNGQPITISAAKYLEDARLDTELAAQDAGLFEVAASCMLRG